MGVSTVASYTGAQIFEALGLSQQLVDKYFTGTTSQARRHRARHDRRGGRAAAPAGLPASTASRPRTASLEIGGEYQWRREGELHLFDPETVFRLQHATRTGQLRRLQAVHRAGQRAVRAADDAARAVPLQGAEGDRQPIHIDEVEPVSEIVKRFSTGAMSYGSISAGGARDARDRDEPARRQVQHRRGRRGRRPAATTRERRSVDQAGRVRPLRRHLRST